MKCHVLSNYCSFFLGLAGPLSLDANIFHNVPYDEEPEMRPEPYGERKPNLTNIVNTIWFMI